jgi:hypothetical protein
MSLRSAGRNKSLSATDAGIDRPVYVQGWLRGPAMFSALTGFLMRDFLRSPWTIANLVIIALAHLILFGEEPTRVQFFNLSYLIALGLAGFNTAVIFARANHPHTYHILARPVTRTAFITAALLASWVVGVTAFLISALLVIVRYGPLFGAGTPAWLSFGELQAGTIAIVVGITFMVSLMALLSNFVSPFWVRFLVLGLIALTVMAFDPRSFPVEQARPWVRMIPPVLAPVFGAVRYATEPRPDALAIASIIVVASYATLILALVLWLSTRRELELE